MPCTKIYIDCKRTLLVYEDLGSGTVGSHQSIETSLTGTGGTITRVSAANISARTTPSAAGPSKPGVVTFAGLLSPPGNPLPETMKLPERRTTEKEDEEKEPVLHRVKVRYSRYFPFPPLNYLGYHVYLTYSDFFSEIKSSTFVLAELLENFEKQVSLRLRPFWRGIGCRTTKIYVAYHR